MNVSEQAPGVFFVEGPASNWLIVRDASGFMLIDGGYPADRDLVLESVRGLGLEPADARAMLITHGHVDHTGSAAYFSRTFGTPILCSPEELAHVQGKEKHQVTFGQVLLRAWRPQVFRWMLHVIKAKALQAEPATRAEAWMSEALRHLPGKPEAILLPGHTPGNVALLLPDAGAIAVGDTFVSGHPISPKSGPQMLHRMYHSDARRALTSALSLGALQATERATVQVTAQANEPATAQATGQATPQATEPATAQANEPATAQATERATVQATVILPGHGPALHMPLAQAVRALRT
ncbi:MBL fold metallo-hydrolase [Arthrobacter sp. StoSoilB20]|uniref:MBL fold metallo-hydrolase n=1 Tax=Arthrobacter sp. StoSoilB20 TaxID=2830995 RepID=UPI001CC34BC7|nr:MBL fold metallo-hydrolase [Arthrobacter sp. StoSoilB20]